MSALSGAVHALAATEVASRSCLLFARGGCSPFIPLRRNLRATECAQRSGVHGNAASAVRAPSLRATVVCATSAANEVQGASLGSTPATPFLTESGAPTAFPAASGIYAIVDKEGTVQYMGLSRRLNGSLQVHLSELPELCGAAKILPIPGADKNSLVEAWKKWMEEHVAATGGAPPGNQSGNATWTTRKAKKAKPEIRLTPGPHVQLTVPLTDLIERVIKEHRVVLFLKGTRTAPECGFSHRVLTILNECGAEYETLNVLDEEHNPGLRDSIKAYSQWPTIPQLYVKGEFVGGADIVDEMMQSGQLKPLLLGD